jgi:uncharacterized protein YjbI with pentapeptide repeats
MKIARVGAPRTRKRLTAMTPTTTTNTKTVFQKAPLGVMKTRTFTVLATLLLIEGVMIGQVLSRPGASQTGQQQTVAAEDCKKVIDPKVRAACWVRKAKTGRKDLTGAELLGADLRGVDLTGTDLTGATLTVALLTKATLTGATLTGANLTNADLSKAKLTEANLSKANLTGAKLTGANLSKANLTGADLTGADLTGATLTGADLTGIKKDANTKGLPPGS